MREIQKLYSDSPFKPVQREIINMFSKIENQIKTMVSYLNDNIDWKAKRLID
jgi:hypothetical protein